MERSQTLKVAYFKSFVQGMAHVFVFSNTFAPSTQGRSRNSNLTDSEALRLDWEQVGSDLYNAIEEYKNGER